MFIVGADSSLNAAPPNFDFFYVVLEDFVHYKCNWANKRNVYFVFLRYCSCNIKYILNISLIISRIVMLAVLGVCI